MHLVYRNAACTIAAGEADSLSQGLLGVPRPAIRMACVQLLELLGSPQDFVITYDWTKFSRTRLRKLPLAKRGWVLQESLLSRRTIYFGSPLIWECRQSRQACGQAQETEFQYPLVPQPKIWPTLLRADSDVHRYWHRAVIDFSGRVLTHLDDKLLAVSGIAKTISPIMQSEYLAGVWKEFLIQDLLWTVEREAANTVVSSSVSNARSKNYRGIIVIYFMQVYNY